MWISNWYRINDKCILGDFWNCSLDFVSLQKNLPFPTSSCLNDVWIGMILWDVGYHVIYLNLYDTQMVRSRRHYDKVNHLHKSFNIKSNEDLYTKKCKCWEKYRYNFLSMCYIAKLFNIKYTKRWWTHHKASV